MNVSATLRAAVLTGLRPFIEQDISEEIARDEEPLMVPVAQGQRPEGGQVPVPTAMLHPQWPMLVENASMDLPQRRAIRSAAERSAALWGLDPRDPDSLAGMQVRTHDSSTGGLPDDVGHEGRTLVRRRDGRSVSALMDVVDAARPEAGAIPHEVGHWALGGDYQHRDPRWRSPQFWRNLDRTLGNTPGTNRPVDWEGY